jgi:H+/Cl- antiporter ClcA
MKRRLLSLVQWLGLGVLVGVLAGSASALFLFMLQRVTALRVDRPVLIWGLPLAGWLLGLVYQRFGREILPGNNLVLDRIHDNGPRLPFRMAPMVLLGTVWSHLFGASVGREGSSVQMGAVLADGLAHGLNLDRHLRRHLLAAGIAGGFGSVFGTPLAGAVFGLEVVVLGRLDYEALVPALVASVVGDHITRAWGIHHQIFPVLPPHALDLGLGLRWLAFAALVAATAWAFIELTHGFKRWSLRLAPALPWRLTVGGLGVVLLWQLLGTDAYLGLSTSLISQAFGNDPGLPLWGFAAKLLLTAFSLGFGFIGGEVTPLFVIGALLGFSAASVLNLPVELAVGVGLAALFGACANTPLAMTVMAVELLGANVLPHVAVVAVLAWLLSGHRSIYSSQRAYRAKHGGKLLSHLPLLHEVERQHPQPAMKSSHKHDHGRRSSPRRDPRP